MQLVSLSGSGGAVDGPEEGRLIQLAKLGDRAAYGQLFDRYRGSVYRLALQRVGDPYLAEDVVQETFLRAWSSLGGYDSSRRFFPWLASIAINRSADLWHQNLKLQPFGLMSEDASARATDTTWEQAVVSLQRDRLRGALRRLSPKQRHALLLHDLEGFPYPDVALLVGTTQLAARSLVFRARAAMRSALRTLGLAILAWRRFWRQARSSLPPGSEWAVGLVTASLSVAMALAPFGHDHSTESEASDHRTVVRPNQLMAAPRPSQRTGSHSDSQTPILPAPSVPPEHSVTLRAEVGPRRPDAAGPSREALGIAIVSPDGQTIYYADTWLECRDVGRLPDSGPVRTAC